jgi:hypothetical protein
MGRLKAEEAAHTRTWWPKAKETECIRITIVAAEAEAVAAAAAAAAEQKRKMAGCCLLIIGVGSINFFGFHVQILCKLLSFVCSCVSCLFAFRQLITG